MRRTFKRFAIQSGGTPQPLIGTWVTASTSPSASDQAGNTVTNIPVNDSSMFRQGDWAFLIDAALTASKGEKVWVQSVPDSTHIKVKGLQQSRVGGAFGTGDFVQLAVAVNSVYVQCDPANATTLYIGTQGMNKTGLVKVVAQLLAVSAGVQPIEYSDTRYYGPDPDQSSDLWCDGQTADGYLPSFGVS